METAKQISLLPAPEQYLHRLETEVDLITPSRREKLEEIAAHIAQHADADGGVKLIFICTHNSRRSQMAQLWAAACARRSRLSERVECYSGGTVATAFYPKAVRAMENAGWKAERITAHPEFEAVSTANPGYLMSCSDGGVELSFSKHFAKAPNPQKGFTAVMVCSDADAACPFVPGATARFALPYDDPKAFDARPEAEEKYKQRCAEIAAHMNYLFRKVAELVQH